MDEPTKDEHGNAVRDEEGAEVRYARFYWKSTTFIRQSWRATNVIFIKADDTPFAGNYITSKDHPERLGMYSAEKAYDVDA